MLVRPNGERRLVHVMANATLLGRIAAGEAERRRADRNRSSGTARLSARRRREIVVSGVKTRMGHE